MEAQIVDGVGSSYLTKVTEGNRLCTDSISREQLEYACLTGNGFNISTGAIVLTSDSESGVGYFKYDGAFTVVIKEIIIILGGSTGGTGKGVITLVKNPTGGSVVSGALPVAIAENRDFSSASIIEGSLFKGEEGRTITGGNDFAVTSRDNFDLPVSFDAAPIVLRKGNSLGIKYTPPTGNTSQSIIVAGTIYIEKTNIK